MKTARCDNNPDHEMSVSDVMRGSFLCTSEKEGVRCRGVMRIEEIQAAQKCGWKTWQPPLGAVVMSLSREKEMLDKSHPQG